MQLTRLPIALCCVTTLFGCAAEQSVPSSDARMAQRTCTVLRMEELQRESDNQTDSVFLMFVFRPGASAGHREHAGHEEHGAQPISMQVQVQRERVDDLRAQLQANPELMCEPEPGTGTSLYRLRLP
jgi:hypothetical protein